MALRTGERAGILLHPLIVAHASRRNKSWRNGRVLRWPWR